MHVLNAAQSRDYFDSLVDECEDSAVNVIHGAWLEHSSTLARLERLEAKSPLDMLVLYKAAASTFRDWAPGASQHEEISQNGYVINREQAQQMLRSISDPDLAALAMRFANQVVALSDQSAAEQDLEYYVDLFLHVIRDRQVIDSIISGSISKHSKLLTDLDYW